MTDNRENGEGKNITAVGEEKPLRQLVTIKEAAKKFGLSEHYIRRACKRGELPYITIGNRNKLIDVELMNTALTVLANKNQNAAAERYNKYLEENYPVGLHFGALSGGR